MEHNAVEKEVAKELALQILSRINFNCLVDRNDDANPRKIGENVAGLYNAILDNLHE